MKEIGEFLKNIRLEKKIKTDELLKKTTLTEHIVHLIENGNFSSIGAPFYIKNFISQYCSAIGLTEKETDEVIRKILGLLEKKENSLERKKAKNSKAPWLIAVVFVFLLGFTAFWFLSGRDVSVKREVKGESYSGAVAQEKESRSDFKNLQNENNEKKEIVVEGKKNISQIKEDALSKTKNKTQKNVNKLIVENKSIKRETNFSDNGSIDLPPRTKLKNTELSKNTQSQLNNPVKVVFKASCMCWVNISFNGKVLRDFILKEGEVFSIDVEKGAVISVGNAKCLKLFFGPQKIKLPDTKVVKGIVVK